MQTSEVSEAFRVDFRVPKEKLLLMAKIAWVAPMLQIVTMSDNSLGTYGPAIAEAIASSPTIHTAT